MGIVKNTGVLHHEMAAQLDHLTVDQLLAIGRNDAALPEFRKYAVSTLVDRGFAVERYPELNRFVPHKPLEDAFDDSHVNEPAEDLDDVIADLYTSRPALTEPNDSDLKRNRLHFNKAEPTQESGPLKASVTTETMFGNSEVVQKMDDGD